jgi:hypothetical protein
MKGWDIDVSRADCSVVGAQVRLGRSSAGPWSQALARRARLFRMAAVPAVRSLKYPNDLPNNAISQKT